MSAIAVPDMSEWLTVRFRQNTEETFYASAPEVGIRDPISVGDWAKRFRRIGQGGSPLSMSGDIGYDVSVMPWCAEPMEAALDPQVSHLIMWWGAGLGKSDGVVTNIIGWAISESPRNIMALYPNENSRDKWSRDVLQRTIDATPILRESVVEKKGRESGNTISYKAFPGGSLYATAAGSPSNLRGPRVGLAYAGEVDAMPSDVGGAVGKPGEGDPLRLLFKRCEGFEDAIKIVEGTGTVKGRSRIEAWYDRSDKRRWFVPCRRCGTIQVLYFRHVKWPKGKPHKAELECEHCSAMHTDAQRLRIVREGKWKPTAAFSGYRGYWINAINTTLPAEKGYSNKLHQIAKEWIDAKHSESPRESLRTFVNTVLAETDDSNHELEARMPWEPLYERREFYATDNTIKPTVPEPVRVLTGGIDVQSNRVEMLVKGWGRDEQNWALELLIIYGDPNGIDLWNALEKAVLTRYEHASGAELEITIAFIDRGRWTDAVDAFAERPALSGRVYTVKGASEMGLPVVGRISKTGHGGTYFRLGTDAAKEWIYGKLALPYPEKTETFAPGFCHHPQSFDAEFFKQLTAERAKTVYERGRQFRKYVVVDEAGNETKSKVRNEGLDMSVYALAAFRLRRWDWDELDASLAESANRKDVKEKPKPRREDEDRGSNWITGGRKW